MEWWLLGGFMVVLMLALRVRSRVQRMDSAVRWNIDRVDELEKAVLALTRRLGEGTQGAAPSAVVPTSVATAAPVAEPSAPTPTEAAPSVAISPVEVGGTLPTTTEPAVVEGPIAVSTVLAARDEARPPAVARAAEANPATPTGELPPSALEAPSAATPSAAPPRIPEEPLAARALAKPFNWESLVGVKLFSYVAGFALLVAAVFFLQYSNDQGWLGPPVKVAIGLLVGVSLLVGCELRGRRYPITANALDASGIGILFATTFAADALWHLLSPVPTFALMALVTAVAVMLSLRHNAIFVALLGLVGGFATPILLSTGEDKPIGLFSYLVLLNVGLALVAYRKGWSLLSALSLLFTVLYQWGWFFKFAQHDRHELPLAAGIFLLFPILTAVANFLGERAPLAASPQPLRLPNVFGSTTVLSALTPLLFALCLAWTPELGVSQPVVFGFLVLADVGLAVLAAARGPRLLHVASGLATLLVLAGWISQSGSDEGWPYILGWVAVFVALYLAAPFVAERLGHPLDGAARRANLTAPLLLFAFPALAWLEPRAAAPGLLFGVLLAVALVISAVAVLREEGPLHFVAAFFAVAAEAVWSAKHLSAERLTDALVLYAVLGIFYLGVPVVARRLGKRLLPEGSGAFLLLVSLAMLLFLAAGPVAHTALWGMGLLLAMLNLGLFFDARASKLPKIAIVGVVLSWVVIAVWWATAMVAGLLLPALVIVAGFTVIIVAGNLWATPRPASLDEKPTFPQGLYLGLVGHVFLLFVASRAELTVPPWPLLGILAVLDLAILAASLYSRRGELHAIALAASQLIVLDFLVTSRAVPAATLTWPRVALLASLSVGALGLAGLPLARLRRAEGLFFFRAAAVALVLGQLVACVAGAIPEAPTVAWLAVVVSVLFAALLWLGQSAERHGLSLAALALPAAGVLLWQVAHLQPAHWATVFAMAGPPYVLATLYPIVLGARARGERLPYVLAVLASAPFFWALRVAISLGGHDDVVGLLPVAQALVLAGVLVHLLRLEAGGPRDRGRLALVAGAALAFITLAIPLQLDRQWITIGWALEAAALAWLHRKLVHRGLLAASFGLVTAVVIRLSLNPAVFEYEPRQGAPLLNWYLYAYLVSAFALFVTAWQLRRADDRPFAKLPRVSQLASAGATLLLFLLLNIEIADWYSKGPSVTFNFSSSTLAQDLTYTLGWAAFAVALLAAGVFLRVKATRVAALALLVITIVKCFFHDLARLEGLYRVGSFVALAVCLALVAIVLQKFVLVPDEPAEDAP